MPLLPASASHSLAWPFPTNNTLFSQQKILSSFLLRCLSSLFLSSQVSTCIKLRTSTLSNNRSSRSCSVTVAPMTRLVPTSKPSHAQRRRLASPASSPTLPPRSSNNALTSATPRHRECTSTTSTALRRSLFYPVCAPVSCLVTEPERTARTPCTMLAL